MRSIQSEIKPVGQLATPVISRSGSKVQWSAVSGANIYKVYDQSGGVTDIQSTEFNLDINTVGSYSYYIYAYYLDPDGIEYISDQSNTISFTIAKITAPVIDLNSGTSELYFSAVSNATKYYLSTNGSYSNTLTTAYTSVSPYIISKDTVGTYSFKLQALNDNLGWYNNTVDTYYIASDNSNDVSYQVIKILTPSTIAYDTETDEISWSASANADTYELYINDSLVQDSSALFYTITASYSDAVAYVIAHKGQVTNPNPKCLPSTKAEAKTVSFGKLPTPILTKVDNVFSWTNLSTNTLAYYVYDSGELIYITQETTKTILTNTAKTFNITVLAYAGGSETISNSELSNEESFTFYKLTAPIVEVTDNILTWTTPENALTYNVYRNNKLIISGLSYNSIDVSSYILGGNNDFYIRANNTSYPQYLISDASNTIEINSNTTYYTCNIDDMVYNLQLPIHPTFTEDGSLDAMEINLEYNNDPIEVKTGTDVSVFVNDTDNNVPLKEWNMIVSKDTVEEVQIGASSRYAHHLDLIELTRRLQSEFIPDVTVTQPLDYISSLYLADAAVGDLNNNIMIDSNIKMVAPTNSSYPNDHYIADIPATIKGVRVPTKAILNSEISLPKVVTGYLYREYEDFFGYTHKQNITLLTKEYYLKNVTTGVETLITKTTSRLDIKYKLDTPGNFQIILRIPDYQVPNTNSFYDDSVFLLKFMTAQGTNIDGLNQVLMYDNSVGDENDYEDMKQSFEMTWNIEVVDSTTLETSEDVYTCWDAIVKILNNLTPLEISDIRYIETTSYPDNNTTENIGSNCKIQSPKYSLDPDLEVLLKSKISPKLTYQDNKTLYEALLSIGVEFNGIPRLLKYKKDGDNLYTNVISYDIMNEYSGSAFDTDGTELQIVNSSLNNYSTGIISNVKNIVSKDNVITYPSNNYWASARSTNVTDPYTTKMNMGLILPFNIHQLVSLEIKDPVTDTVYDITSYILEKKKWDTLNADKDGQGLSLYWIRGNNKIYNMGAITAQTETEAVFGLASTEYVIQNIAKTVGMSSVVNDASSNYDLNNVVYRVKYIPYTNTRLMLEKNNQYNTDVELYTNFNQSENTITDYNYGVASQVNLSKLGNTEVTKNYIFHSISELPMLGQYKIVNGEKYYVDKYSFSIYERYISCSVLFTKNSNKLNPRMGIKNDYRQYELYDSDWVERVVNINHYCYLALESSNSENQNDFETTEYNLIHNILQSFNYVSTDMTKPYKAPDTFYITPKKNLVENLQYTPYGSTTKTDLNSGLLQASNLTVGNAIAIYGKCYDNFSVGVKATDLETTGSIHGAGKYIQKNIRYVDDLGKTPFINIVLGNLKDSNNITSERQYPEADTTTNVDNNFDNVYLNKTLYIQKDNREALNFNYQINFVSKDKDINIHNGLTKYIFTNSDAVSKPSPVYVLYKGNINNYDYVTDYKEVCTPKFYQNSGSIRIYKDINDPTITAYENYDGIALVWLPQSQNGNSSLPEVIYSYKTSIASGDTVEIPDIYWNFTDTK